MGRADNPATPKEKIMPFPRGFQMVGGNPSGMKPDPKLDTDPSKMKVSYKCLSQDPEISKTDTPGFPKDPSICANGVRARK